MRKKAPWPFDSGTSHRVDHKTRAGGNHLCYASTIGLSVEVSLRICIESRNAFAYYWLN
ncbi:MAG TPA: hypothetical protein PKO36_07250 [Candidatus Hydrogenedentes bacterium]|nr:hypothetical protein [Candidatus Hydrogenedentota bacterium]